MIRPRARSRTAGSRYWQSGRRVSGEEIGTVTENVLHVLRERMRHGSTPRTGKAAAGLVLLVEGGSWGGASSGGMPVAIEDLGRLPGLTPSTAARQDR